MFYRGCGEGGCGACTIVVSQFNPTTKEIYHASVNACLAPLVSLDGKHVITIEGIGNTKGPHPTQERVAKSHGSQCGFCTPGIVMSLYALLRNNSEPSEHDMEEAFDGNLCRCTGYRPILDAAHTFSAKPACGMSKANGGGGCCMDEKKTNGTNGVTNGSINGGVHEITSDKTNGTTNGGGCCMDKGNGKPSGGCCMDKKTDDQPIKRFTPPGFIEYNPDTELIFPPQLKKQELRPLSFGNKRKTWLRPVTLDQLLQIKSVYPDAKIIGGSTETQIEIKFKQIKYPISVYVGDIAELRQYAFHDDHVEIGGNVVLTDVEGICEKAMKHYGPVRGQVFEGILKQLKYFAGRQIRNVGTPAGNLVTASPISDLNPALWGANAVLIAKSASKETELPMNQFFIGYRKTALPQDAIISSIRIPVTAAKGEFYRTYKQAKRKDDDIAIVTSSLRVKVDDEGIVESCNLIYGGMGPFTLAAKQAQDYLIGKRFAELETLEGTMSALERDFDMKYDVPGGMPSYRKALAFGFFYRFYHDALSNMSEADAQADSQAVGEIERALSKGAVDEHSAAKYEKEVTGKSNPHVAALKQTTGEAQYTDDIPAMKNELHASWVLSTKPHAKIKSIDYGPALDMPGVVDYVDHTDMPSAEANKFGTPFFDDVIFAVDEVQTAGQPIALILATSASRAHEAARAVKIEYEVLPAVLSIEEAIEANSYLEFSKQIVKGDTEKAFANSDYVFTGTVRMGGQEHFYLETNACLVVPKPEDGEMEIFASTQNTTET